MYNECLTQDSKANDQLLYFTSSSLTKDDKLVFISDRTGHPNLFVKDLDNGQTKQLTFNEEGYLKSYVYFDGNEYQGFGKASVSLDPERGNIYYIQGRNICRVNTVGESRVLAEYPEGQMTAFTHVSSDGSRLCVPTTDARALEAENLSEGRPDYDIDQRVQEESLSSYLNIYDTDSGQLLKREEVPKAWITHVQFSPLDNELILYNHEWPGDCGIRRVWLWDGEEHTQIRREGIKLETSNVPTDKEENISQKERKTFKIKKEDWVCHEMWERSGEGIIYHGQYQDGPMFIGRLDLKTSKLTEIPFPEDYIQYGHFTVGNKGILVSDGYYQKVDEDPENGVWISIQRVDWENGEMEWVPLLKHQSSWDSQDSHPHPIFDHNTRYIYYTSDEAGQRDIYRIQM